MIYYLLLTAFIVSIDSFFCGFSLSFTTKTKYKVVMIITITVLIMCLFTNALTSILLNVLSEKSSMIGGVILLFIGAYNLSKIDDNPTIKCQNLSQIFLSGFAVGIDGAIATISLSLMEINYIYVPFVIALFHGIMIFLGISLSNSNFGKKLEKHNYIPPIILILLGIYKIICAVI